MKSSTEAVGLAPLGIFGGTFDPVHLAHLRLAEEAADQLGLATVRWIPAAQPYHRQAPLVSAAHRLAMVRLAVADNPRFAVDAAEIDSQTPTYSVPTLERVRDEVGPARPLVLLVGADAFAGITSWHRWTELLGLAHIAVTTRPGCPLDLASLPPALATEYQARQADVAALQEAPAGHIVSFAMTPLAVSATQVRSLLARGASPRYLLPDEVIAYIRRHFLYRSDKAVSP